MSSDVILSNLHILIQDVIFDVLLPLGTPSPLCVLLQELQSCSGRHFSVCVKQTNNWVVW